MGRGGLTSPSMRLHRVRRVDLVPLELRADLVRRHVQGHVALGAVQLDVAEEGFGEGRLSA
jgi:hypothetical protein